MRTLVCLLLCGATLAAIGATSRSASAAESNANDPTASHALTAEASMGLAFLRNQQPDESPEPYLYAEVAPAYRVSPALSLGAVIGYATPEHGGARMWRVSGEARYHFVRTRRLDAWAGGDIGFAVTRYEQGPCMVNVFATGEDVNPCPASAPDLVWRVEPVVGGSLGLEVLPLPYVSIGVVARGMVIAFGSAVDLDMPAGLTPSLFAGLSLGLHVPLGT